MKTATASATMKSWVAPMPHLPSHQAFDDDSCLEVDAGICGGLGDITNVDVRTFLKDCDCDETSSMQLVCAVATVQRMKTWTAFVTTSTMCGSPRCVWRNATVPVDLQCGCSDIPEGDCDCDGNQLDECGN